MRRKSLWSSWTSKSRACYNRFCRVDNGWFRLRIGRGTTLQAGVSIAYATLDYLLTQNKCRTLFATHYHELAQMLRSGSQGQVREGVEFWCTDVDEMVRST